MIRAIEHFTKADPKSAIFTQIPDDVGGSLEAVIHRRSAGSAYSRTAYPRYRIPHECRTVMCTRYNCTRGNEHIHLRPMSKSQRSLCKAHLSALWRYKMTGNEWGPSSGPPLKSVDVESASRFRLSANLAVGWDTLRSHCIKEHQIRSC